MSNYDNIYKNLVEDVLKNGVSDEEQEVRTVWADGTPAHTLSLVQRQITLDNKEVPILTTKHVAWKSAIHELLWFYVHRTSEASYLQENKVKIWDEWLTENNDIGLAYGAQLGKSFKTGVWKRNSISGHLHAETTNQVKNLIQQLKTNPSSRRHVISLWNIDDLHTMSLYPCVWANQWIVQNNKLHLIVQVRSNDIALGQPFNIFQYYVLQRMMGQITGYEMGELTFNINNPHIYTRHIEALKGQNVLPPYEAPELWINPKIKNFDDFTIDDFKLIDYKHHGKIYMEVAI